MDQGDARSLLLPENGLFDRSYGVLRRFKLYISYIAAVSAPTHAFL